MGNSARFNSSTRLSRNITWWVFSCFIRRSDSSGPFYLDKQQLISDPLCDDQSLWIKTKQGTVILTGCCHAGIENSVKQIQKQSNTDNIHSILGGLHLHNATQSRQKHNAEFLKLLRLKKLYPAHCSGEIAQKQLQHSLGDDIVQQSKVGLT